MMANAAPTRAEELKLAICCLRYVVEKQPEIRRLVEQVQQTGSDKNKELLLKKRDELRQQAVGIITKIVESRGYDYVFDSPKTRREAIVENHMEGMLISYSGDDISDEVSDILSGKTQIKEVEQPGAAQPATQPADKAPAKDQPPTPTSEDAPR